MKRKIAYEIFKQIENTHSNEDTQKAIRMISRAGMPLDEPDTIHLGETDTAKRKREVDSRRDWEAQFSSKNSIGVDVVSDVIHDKIELEKDMKLSRCSTDAEQMSSELIARAGAGSAFTGEKLGIGGLDDVLSQVKRRIWTPLAAPPSLLQELGTQPVRGLLLYGLPGCGKTLLARSLGKILSPSRACTIVSGPEIMDRYDFSD